MKSIVVVGDCDNGCEVAFDVVLVLVSTSSDSCIG